MIVWIYNITFILFLGLFSFLFNVYDFAFDSVWFYIGILGSFLGAFVTSGVTVLLVLRILAEFRKNKPIDNMLNHRIINSTLVLARKLLRYDMIITGRENIPKPPFVIVANHQENYDGIVIKPIFSHIPVMYITKKAFFKTPVLGKWASIIGFIPITKEADRGAAEAIVKGTKLIKKGISVGIFPEGKRSFSNTMLPFKAGAFKLAMKPKADLLILTQYNVINTFKGWPFKKQKIYVHIHPVLPYSSYQGKTSQELADEVRAIIQEQLDKFTELYG
jgi:1-acyl-sn-glycerol-3-phosphate acyltransferase